MCLGALNYWFLLCLSGSARFAMRSPTLKLALSPSEKRGQARIISVPAPTRQKGFPHSTTQRHRLRRTGGHRDGGGRRGRADCRQKPGGCQNYHGPVNVGREAQAKERGLAIFARMDHAAGAAKIGKTMRPTEVLIFGNPQGGTPFMAFA